MPAFRSIDHRREANSCASAPTPPFDHPHVFLDMGDDDEKVCPYCSTLYRYRPPSRAAETDPPGHLYREPAAA